MLVGRIGPLGGTPVCWCAFVMCLKVEPLSNSDTNGAEESVFVSEVSSFQRLSKSGTWGGKGVLFREVSSVRVCS